MEELQLGKNKDCFYDNRLLIVAYLLLEFSRVFCVCPPRTELSLNNNYETPKGAAGWISSLKEY